MTTLTWTTELVTTSCWCGIPLAIPSSLMREAKDNKKSIYCPLGHTFVFGKTTVDQLRAELDQVKADRDWYINRKKAVEAEVEHQKARANGYKGALTKTKKRIGKGVCPCCNRHFANVERHMATQHPELTATDNAAAQA